MSLSMHGCGAMPSQPLSCVMAEPYPSGHSTQAQLGLVQDALKVARRLSEEVLKVAGLSEDEIDGKQAAEKAAVEVGCPQGLVNLCRVHTHFTHWLFVDWHSSAEQNLGS